MPDHAPPAVAPDDTTALLTALFDQADAGFLHLDAELTVERVSPHFGALMRVPSPEAGCGLADWLAGLLAAGGFAAPSTLAHLLAPFRAPEGATARWEGADGRLCKLVVRALPGGGRLASLSGLEPQEELGRGLLRSPYLLGNVTDTIVLMDAEGVILDNSSGRGELLGLPDDLVQPGCTHSDILRFMYRRGDFETDVPEEAFVAQRRAMIVSAGRFTLTSQMPDGRWAEYNFRPLPNGQMLILVRDVTELRRALAALEAERTERDEERGRARLLLEGTQDAILLYNVEGVLIEASHKFGSMFDLPEELFRPGALHADLVRMMYRRGDYGSDRAEEEVVADFRVKATIPGRVQRIRRMPNGRWVEMNFEISAKSGMLLIARDITDLKNVQTALELEQEKLRIVTDNMHDAVMLFDSDMRWRITNAPLNRFFGYPDHFGVGTSAHEAFRFSLEQGEFGQFGSEAEIEAEVQRRVEKLSAPEGFHDLRQTSTGIWLDIRSQRTADGGVVAYYRDVTELKRQEQRAEAEREKLRIVMDNMHDGVMLFDRDLCWTLVSEPIMRFFDLPRDLGVGTPLTQVARFQILRGDFGPPPEGEAAIAAEVTRRIGGMLNPGGRRYLRKTLAGYWLDVRMQPMPDGGLLAYYRDVTALKQQEEQVEAERQLLRELLNGMDEAVVLLGPDQRIMVSNVHAHEYLTDRPELVEPGVSIREVLRHLYRRGDYGFGMEEEARIDERVAFMSDPAGQRLVRTGPDGRWIEFQYSTISGGRVLIQARDVTMLKQRENEVEEQRALLAEMLDSMDSIVVLASAEGEILLSNGRDREVLEMQPDQPARRLADYYTALAERGDYGPIEDIPAFAAARQVAVLEGGMQRYTRRMPSGRWVEFIHTPISHGRVIAQGRDVTALKENEQAAIAGKEAAEAAAQVKSAFLAAMSHEIRTPMNGVLGMLEVLGRSELKPDQARSVTVMRESAHSLLRIIDDVLDFSKIEAGRLEVEALPFSLKGIVDGTIETLTPEAKRRGLALFADAQDPGLDWLEGDPTRVRQILFNLVGNALKFTERGYVRIAVHTRAVGGRAHLTLSVEDSGVGMDEAALGRLFQPFSQADSSTTRRFGGTGLGLSIVRRLAELMGGDVRAESQPGRGSRFTVTLVLGIAAAPPALARSAPAAPAAAKTSEVFTGGVLVVDDHPVNREVILRQLEILGVTAATANDGAQALETWRRERQAILLLDIHMPVMDGFELARAIRSDEQARGLSRTTLIAVTANALKGEAERCYAAGMDGFLTKPVTLDELSRALARFVPAMAGEAAGQGVTPGGGALFDPEALRGLFGQDRARLSSILESFAEQARHDILGMLEVQGKPLGDAAHRLKGAARMVGARLLAEQAQAVEAAVGAGDAAAASAACARLEELLSETLRVARGLLSG